MIRAQVVPSERKMDDLTKGLLVVGFIDGNQNAGTVTATTSTDARTDARRDVRQDARGMDTGTGQQASGDVAQGDGRVSQGQTSDAGIKASRAPSALQSVLGYFDYYPVAFPIGYKDSTPRDIEIGIADIVPTQDSLKGSAVEQYARDDGGLLPEVVLDKSSGRYILLDGHHRVAGAVVRGDDTVQVTVVGSTERATAFSGFKSDMQADWRASFPGDADRQVLDVVTGEQVGQGADMKASRRTSSGNRLPDVVIGHRLGELNNHPDYEAAKAGDSMAAARIASDLVDDAMVEAVRKAAGNAELIVPVLSVESTGRNKIPQAVAQELADRLGTDTADNIVQADSPKRTNMDGLSRLLNPPVFDGPVTPGTFYVLVDDTVTQGGTFASLASHIRDNGGEVAGVVALTGKQYSAKLEPSSELLQQVRDRFQSVEPAFRAATGYGFDALTESEARYLVKHNDAESVRTRITEAGLQRIEGSDQGVPEGTARKQSQARPQPVTPRTAVAAIRTAITKAYGNILTRLEGKGLVSLTQTEEEAIAAAAQARADQKGGDVEAIKESLRKSVLASVAPQTEGVAIAQQNANVNEAIGKWAAGNLPSGTVLQIGRPSSVLQQFGVPDLPIHLAQRILKKAVKEKHDVDVSDLKDLALNIQSPLAVFASKMGDGHRVLVTEARHADGNVIVALELETTRNGLEINDITSIHPKRDGSVASWLGEGRLMGYEKSKGRKWLENSAGSNSQQPQAITALDSAIVYETDTLRNSPTVVSLDIKRSADGNLEGFFDPATGKSFLIADNLTAESAPATLMHEVGIHRAAEGGGKTLELIEQAGAFLQNERDNAFIQRVQARMDESGETSNEEAAAYIVTEYERDRTNAPASVGKWIKDFIADVRAWLFAKGVLRQFRGKLMRINPREWQTEVLNAVGLAAGALEGLISLKRCLDS